MIRLLIAALTFYEADYLLRTMKKKAFVRSILVCTAIWICFNILFFLPIIVSGKNLILLFTVFLILFSAAPFLLILRIRRIGYSENALLRRIEPSSKEKKKLLSLMREKMTVALAVYVLLFSVLFGYALLISLLFLVFRAITLSIFLIQLLVAAILSIIILSLFLFRRFLFGKKWKWVKTVFIKLFGFTGLPFVAAGLTVLLLFLIGLFYFPGWKPAIVISITAGVFFSYPLLKHFLKDKRLFISFRFTVLVFSILVIIIFLSPLDFTFEKGGTPCEILFYEFINPLIETFMAVFRVCRAILAAIPFPLLVISPLLFFPVCALNRGIYVGAYILRKRYEKRLNRTLFSKMTRIYFGGVLSPYHVLFSSLGTLIIVFILFLEVPPVTQILHGLVVTFKIAQVFRLTFLTYEVIHQFITILFAVITAVMLLRVTGRLFSSLRSYLCLSADEFVFADKRFFSYTLLRIPLKKVNYTMIKQSPLERIFDTGTLFIESSEGSGILRIRGVPFIRERHKLFMEKVKGVL
jgi:hypothetical protein